MILLTGPAKSNIPTGKPLHPGAFHVLGFDCIRGGWGEVQNEMLPFPPGALVCMNVHVDVHVLVHGKNGEEEGARN